MALLFKFDVEQSPDAKSFILTDTTGNYNVSTNPTGWGAPNTQRIHVLAIKIKLFSFENTEIATKIINFVGGIPSSYSVEVFATDFTPVTNSSDYMNENYFIDNVYRIEVEVNSENIISTIEYSDRIFVGFSAISMGVVMTNILAYDYTRPYNSERETLREQVRLLDCLRYSSLVTQHTLFKKNLDSLKRII